VPPLGVYPGRVDDKGRLKLPVDIKDFLEKKQDEGFFATSFDERIARLYPMSEWKKTEKLLQEPGEDSESAEDLWFTAMDLGGNTVIDGQGRMLLPTELRRALGFENQPVRLEYYRGYINVFSEQVYDERKLRARENRSDKLAAFKKKGL